MTKHGAGARTSIEILEERDALLKRVEQLESAVAAIERELEHALSFPETSFMTLSRIATLARRTGPGLASCARARSADERRAQTM